jgi:hypothetical protein
MLSQNDSIRSVVGGGIGASLVDEKELEEALV